MDINIIRKKINQGIAINEINMNVTFYARVSTEHDEQINSLKNQKNFFINMIKSNTHWNYIDGYIDEGITGMSDIKRINFIKMIEDAKKGLFDLIITKEISRFSRNTLDSIKYTRILEEYGVGIYFINDNINTFLPDSELRLTIMSSLAQDEIRRLSERVKFGMNEAIKKGHILGNNTLYGYNKDSKNNLSIIPTEAIIIQKIYHMYTIENISLNKIAKTLNNDKIKTKYNNKWTISTIKKMLKNPKYKGYYCAKKSEVNNYITKKVKEKDVSEWIIYKDFNHIPPIIDENIWNMANEKLNNIKINNKSKYLNRYPFSALLYCQSDNNLYHRRLQLRNQKDVSWICSNSLKNGKKACDSANIRESELKEIIISLFRELNINLDDIKKNILKIYAKSSKKAKNNYEVSKYQKEIKKIITKKEKILEHNINNVITDSEFKIKNDFYNTEIQKYQKLMEDNRHPNEDVSIISKEIDIFLKSDTIFSKLVSLIISKINVLKVKEDTINLDIYLNINKNITNLKKSFIFQRGYESICTRRYKIKYQINYH